MKEKKIILACWTAEFDFGYETLWWYCIKDTTFDILKVKAKRRYEIKFQDYLIKYFEFRKVYCHLHI